MLKARLRSRWQKIRQRRVAIAVTTAILAVAIVLIIVGYRFDVTGFSGYTQVSTIHTLSGPTAGTFTRTETNQPGKTLWDWMQLLIIPLVLAAAGSLFTFTVSRNERKAADKHNQTEREIAQDNQHKATLQEYINKISELLLHEKLRVSQPEDEVCKIARVLTLTALSQLDIHRKRIVIQFLHESGLIQDGKSIIDLSGADLSDAYLTTLVLNKANLSHTNLIRANLAGTHLAGANLSEALLPGANLISANLTGANLKDATISLEYFVVGRESIATTLSLADLTDANLSDAVLGGADLRETKLLGADLSGANLNKAKITKEQLAKVKSLKGATMPDGSIHP